MAVRLNTATLRPAMDKGHAVILGNHRYMRVVYKIDHNFQSKTFSFNIPAMVCWSGNLEFPTAFLDISTHGKVGCDIFLA